MMPYNTRRKLLSLPSLGIHLPVPHATQRSATRSSLPARAASMETPPSKRLKRSHEIITPILPNSKSVTPSMTMAENTPPPSPCSSIQVPANTDNIHEKYNSSLIDLREVKDEIVEAVIIQLQKTRNRPHLVKELATVLSRSVKIVEQSANPSAIVSSRLSAFIKRSWSPSAPCPITKHLETVHPRRTHYYLTHNTIITTTTTLPYESMARAIISPPISSVASRSDEAETERRRELSPSPEIDLSSTEFDDDYCDPLTSPIGVFAPSIQHTLRNNHRSTSPPLEIDEKEFTQTARGMQKYQISQCIFVSGVPSELEDHPAKSLDYDLWLGKHSSHSQSHAFQSYPSPSPISSPIINSNLLAVVSRNSEEPTHTWPSADLEWDLRSPEHVELEELDGMFDDLRYDHLMP